MSLRTKLYAISLDIERHKGGRNAIMQQSVEGRLNKALLNYDKEVANSYTYLSYRDSLRVMKKINKKGVK